MNVFVRLFIAALVVFAGFAPASVEPVEAQVQNKNQQRCLTKVYGRARKVSSSLLADSAKCIKDGAVAKLPMGVTAQACLTADLKGKVGKSSAKLESDASRFCNGATLPDFGFVDGPTASSAYVDETALINTDLFGSDLDATLAANAATDPKARCTATLMKRIRKLSDTMHKEFERCIKGDLRDETIVDADGVANCLGAITVDARDKVESAAAKIASTLSSGACPAGPDTLLPGFDGVGEICDRYGVSLPADAAGLAECSKLRTACRICRTANDAYALNEACDLFDDGLPNGSCPDCPNGVVDPGEECDDGNAIDGDGCTSNCVIEFCGDGAINNGGTEECDDGIANSDTTPDACRTDCTLPVCGDGVTDSGEDCDEGGVTTATCDADCTLPVCGDGFENTLAGEECDDGNMDNTDACLDTCEDAECGDGFVYSGVEDCDGGECCDVSCAFEAMGTACSGTGGECTAFTCDGAGTCAETPANEGASCDDMDVCSFSSVCTSGVCAADTLVATGEACGWVVVGSNQDDTEFVTGDRADINDGNVCAHFADVFISTAIGGSLVTVGTNNSGDGAEFSDSVDVDEGDIVTNNADVVAATGATLPGLTSGTGLVAAGQVLAKAPAPTFYDTTGSDPRLTECTDAQTALDTLRTTLDALPQTADLGTTYENLSSGTAPTISAVNVGGLNVFDLTKLNGTAFNVTIPMDGGGDTDTVFVLRVAGKIDTAQAWIFDLQNDLLPENVLFYSQQSTGGSGSQCVLGKNNVGGGTFFCPDTKINILSDTVWSGSLLGGAGGGTGRIRIGEDVVFDHVPFTGF